MSWSRWCAIVPLVLLMNLPVLPLLTGWPLVARTLVFSGTLTGLMTWVVMPRMTRLFRRFLYGVADPVAEEAQWTSAQPQVLIVVIFVIFVFMFIGSRALHGPGTAARSKRALEAGGPLIRSLPRRSWRPVPRTASCWPRAARSRTGWPSWTTSGPAGSSPRRSTPPHAPRPSPTADLRAGRATRSTPVGPVRLGVGVSIAGSASASTRPTRCRAADVLGAGAGLAAYPRATRTRSCSSRRPAAARPASRRTSSSCACRRRSRCKNRLHLDLRPDDQAAEVARLEGLGAPGSSIGQGEDVSWVVLADPDGNEFCVLRALTGRRAGAQ